MSFPRTILIELSEEEAKKKIEFDQDEYDSEIDEDKLHFNIGFETREEVEIESWEDFEKNYPRHVLVNEDDIHEYKEYLS